MANFTISRRGLLKTSGVVGAGLAAPMVWRRPAYAYTNEPTGSSVTLGFNVPQTGAYADSGLMTVYAGTAAEQIEELATLTMDEMRRFAEDLSPAEVARARAQMKAGLLMGLESPFGRCERLARSLLIWDRVWPQEETVARIESVDAAAARDAAARMAGSGKLALALYGPVETTPDPDALLARLAG